ncbi:MAG: FAD binding domain-containing protein [Rhizobiales bacterium]|nr:FAD binding domain-containing protein [Hyphomicrobiales bacterium]
MHAFDYIRAASLAEAERLLGSDPEAKLLAGGQTLLPAWKHGLNAPSLLIDLQDIGGLSELSIERDTITVGAMARHAKVARLEDSGATGLAMLAAGIADPQVRNLGTIGGSIANNDPAADYPAAVLGLNATVITNRRAIAADRFFTDLFSTALEPDEIIVAVRFPKVLRAGYFKVANPASGYVTVGAFVADFGDHVRVAINGARTCVYRDEACERLLSEDLSTDALHDYAVAPDNLNDDLHASANYRAHLIPRAIARAIQRLNETPS